ncbi:type I DNA specificity S subunit [Gluconobacter frateurii NBRC 101659]|nr:type I DNA specificity S subunit [Gluconobacter frateurii NBRC 101659]
MSFSAYPKYKDSGIEWLGLIPEHWKALRLKYACTVFPSNVDKHFRDNETSVSLCNYTDVYYNEKITNNIKFMQATASVEQIQKFTLRAGDTIITKDSEAADDIAIAAYVPEDMANVVCGYHLSMVRPFNEINGAFVKRLFDSAYAKARFAVAANGLTRVGLGQYALDNITLPFPPFVEQTAIAAFLDRETGKIDALIAEQEKLLALLAEKRQATISHAVTRGLNPNAPMKDSGIAWLGEVPEHWEVSTLKYHWTVSDCKHITADFVEDGFPLASIREVQGQYVSLKDAKKTTLYFYNLLIEGGRNPVAGDLIFSRNATVGEVAQVTEEHPKFAMGQDVCLLKKIGNDNSSDYFQLVIRSSVVEKQIKSIMIGSTFKRINVEDIRSLVIPVPSVREQKTIAAFVQRENDKFNSLIDQICTQIGFLKERRTALIAAAVTGKIDVRNTVSEVQAS